MASVIDDPNGRRRIQFVAPDQKRKTIRLGKIDRRTADGVARHVESLLTVKITGQPLTRETAMWLAGVPPMLKDRLAAVGLIEVEKMLTVKDYLENWLENRKASGHAVASILAWGQSVRELNTLFGDHSLASLTHSDGEIYRGAMQTRNLRSTTVHKRLGHARQMLEDAVRLGHIVTNPFRHVRQRMGDVSERRAYVSVSDVQRVIEHCPNVWWKLLVALARFGGLRIPSEAFSLKWGHIDWERNRLTVPSPKTSNHGKPHRIIPLFPLLRPHLEAAFGSADEGTDYIIPAEYRQRAQREGGWGGANLRTQFGKIVERAGVEPWPRLWHSLRASCESDLAQSFPLATVTKWLGNTPSVALRHYVDPTEAAFETAVNWIPTQKSGAKSGAQEAQNTAQQVRVGNCRESHTRGKTVELPGVCATSCGSRRHDALTCANVQRECIGIEPTGVVVHDPHRF